MPDDAADLRHRAVSLFDVERDVVEAWSGDSHLAAVLDLLERHIRPDRLASVVRTPATALAEKTILDWIAAGRTKELHDLLKESFDWTHTA